MGRDEASSASDDVENRIVQEDRIAQLEDEMNSERPEETLHPVKKPLELAEELEVKQASTGQDWEEGAAAQPMRLEGVRRGSTVLGYFDVNADNTISRAMKSQAFIRDYGTPQAIVVHLNYIALGMSKGVVVVVPSKYSAQRPDDMDSKMLLLGAQADRSHAPVTSICFNQQGDLLLAGYGDGHIKLWNVPRGTVAKVITGEHVAPVVHTLFLGQDSQVTRQFKAVTGDCKGLVQLHEFSSVPIIGVTVKTQCLLDGQRTGTVLCASPLLPDEFTFSENTTGSSSSIGSVMGGASPWNFLMKVLPCLKKVRLTPSLEVYTQLSKPEGVREGSMPYTAWKCTTQPRASSTENVIPEALERISLLAIAWDRKVQVTKLVKSELKESGKVEPKESGKWTLKVCGKWTLESAAVGLAWLDDQMLVILTLAGQLCLFTKDGNLIHQTTYATNEIGEDDFMSCHTYFTNVYGNPEKAYHNSLAVRGASVYILAPRHVVVSRLLLWQERIEVLRNAGDWMGAFNMAMTLYDGQTHGVIDLPRDLHTAQEAIMPYLVELLFSYVDEVFSYISVACFNQTGKVEEVDDSLTKSISASSEIKEQFSRVGGVAVEFCVHIKRTDILFNQIFSKFVAVQHRDHASIGRALQLQRLVAASGAMKAFVEDEHKLDQSLPDSSDTTVDDLTNSDSGNQNLLIRKLLMLWVIVLDIGISQSVRSAGSDDTGVVLWPSKKDIGQLIEFIASYVASKRATVSKSVLSQMLEHLTSENYLEVNEWEQNCESKKKREKKVLALLDVVPQTEWNTSYVLHLCEKAQFHQVCGQIHNMRNDYFAALDSYMKDADEPVLAFSFIDCILLQLSESESVAFQSTVISRIPELVILSRECTFCLVSYHLNKERGLVFSKLRSTPRSLFLYLKTLFEVYFSGCLNFSSIRVDNVLDGPWDRKNDRKNSLDGYLKRIAEFPKFIRSNPVEVTDDIIELYLELLCQYEPDSVLKFLDTCENYRVDRCLLLCQQYGIVDAAAFLLERVGDVGTALSLTLSGLNDKFNMLDTVGEDNFQTWM
ncbi:Vacuolar protein sorting-associated protein 8-like protein [Bienertia sinuspersici]